MDTRIEAAALVARNAVHQKDRIEAVRQLTECIAKLEAFAKAVRDTCAQFKLPELPEDEADEHDFFHSHRFCAECSFVADIEHGLPSCPCERANSVLHADNLSGGSHG